ncbi:MAG: 50S ribosomal protein L25 [Patescibacteria group bacterium]|nr:50S ribosomal protein L25 [Patescibacteria group bacterium]
METIKLEAIIRKKEQKRTDQKNMVPAILYGKDMENSMLWIDQKIFNKILKDAGESTIIDLIVEGQKEPHKVLVYDLQNDPISDEYTHIDFFRVKMDEEIVTEVELVFVGEASAVKEQGGVLVKNVDSVNVRCLPADLPGSITVDITSLKTFEDHIYIKDLEVSDKVNIEIDENTLVVLVSPPRSEKELEELEEEVEGDISQVEGMGEEEVEEGEGKEEKKEEDTLAKEEK